MFLCFIKLLSWTIKYFHLVLLFYNTNTSTTTYNITITPGLGPINHLERYSSHAWLLVSIISIWWATTFNWTTLLERACTACPGLSASIILSYIKWSRIAYMYLNTRYLYYRFSVFLTDTTFFMLAWTMFTKCIP